MKESEIINKVVNVLSEVEKSKAIAVTDFTEDREENMIVVGIERTTNVNPFLPDFEYDLNIVIDTFIDGDGDGKLFRDTVEKVRMTLDKYVQMGEYSPSELFEEIPVVGMWFVDAEYAINDKSNRCSLSYKVVASFE